MANPLVATSKSVFFVLAAFYFLWMSGFYVQTAKICKVLVRWTSEVKKKFICLEKTDVVHVLQIKKIPETNIKSNEHLASGVNSQQLLKTL